MNDNESPQDGLPAVQPSYSSPTTHRSNRRLLVVAGFVGVALVVAAALVFLRLTGDEPTAQEQFRDIAKRIEAKLGEVAAEREVEVEDYSFEVIEEIYGEERERYPWLGRIDIRWKVPDDPTAAHFEPASATYRWFEPGRRWEYHDYQEGKSGDAEWVLREEDIEQVFRKGSPQAKRMRYEYCRVEFLSESEETVEMMGWNDAIVFKHTGAPLIWQLQVVRRTAGKDGTETVLASGSNRLSATDVPPDARASIGYPGYQGKGIVAIPDMWKDDRGLPMRLFWRVGYAETPGSSPFRSSERSWHLPETGYDAREGVSRPPSVTLRSGQTKKYEISYYMSDSPRSERESVDFALRMTCVDEAMFHEQIEVPD